ncbi:hypothetical protein CDAR_237351 [Caerostris darwini]|uniref:Uncharacterized protein n=1 Tax=Caerostris darwini TaxID=1538125 RepID=A0AAV4QVT3_9ARAC|nr:hypothetical protein CDAR_237351 [Caerostris darwini]
MLRLHPDKGKEADSFHYQHFRMAGPVKQCNETHDQFLAQGHPLNPLILNKALGFFDSLVRNRCWYNICSVWVPDRRKEADSFHYQHFRMAGPVKQCNETHEQFLAQRDPLNPLSLNKALGFSIHWFGIDAGIIFIAFVCPV